MRDPKRIKKVVGKLEELWMIFPDMRFWQMIQILEIPERLSGTDPFFWEDDVWMEIIQNAIDKRCGSLAQ